MTSVASNDDTEASGSASFPLPRHLTPQARARFVGAVREYADALENGIKANAAGRPWTPDPEYTGDDVLASRESLDRRTHHARSERAVQILAQSLTGVGTAGASITGNYLHSGWQISLFVAMIVIGLVGFALPWRGRR
jgi:hypothetical protein